MNWQASDSDTTGESLMGSSLPQYATHTHPEKALRTHVCILWALQCSHLTHAFSFCVSPFWSHKALPCALLAFFSSLFPMFLIHCADSHPLPSSTALGGGSRALQPPLPLPCAACQHLHLPDTAHTAQKKTFFHPSLAHKRYQHLVVDPWASGTPSC